MNIHSHRPMQSLRSLSSSSPRTMRDGWFHRKKTIDVFNENHDGTKDDDDDDDGGGGDGDDDDDDGGGDDYDDDYGGDDDDIRDDDQFSWHKFRAPRPQKAMGLQKI